MLRACRNTFLVLLVQCLIALALFASLKHWLAIVATALASVPIALQFFLDARCRSTGAVARNLLFPALLLKRPLRTALVLLAFAAAPFAVSLLAGEPFNQHYPSSDHNSFTNLCANLSSALIVISLLALLSRSKELRAFVNGGYPRENIANTLFLNISCAQAVIFTCTSAFKNTREPMESYPLLFFHPLVNGIWLALVLYLAISAASCLVMFMVSRRGWASRKVFRMQDAIFLEPLLIFTFVLGAFSRPPDNLFGFFITLCPLGIILITEVLDLMGMEPPEQRRSNLMPLSFKGRFAAANFIVYVIIVSAKLETVYLSAPAYMTAAVFTAFYLVGFYRERRQRQRIIKEIRALDAIAGKEQTTQMAGQFDRKVRAYHELRER
jgi:hypothetical protein